MRRNVIETIMGAVVLLVALSFLWVAYSASQIAVVSGYTLTASFSRLGGLPPGSDVRISGVTVGSVADRRLDPKTYEAIVTMTIDPNIKLPDDTVAGVASEGVLGGKYVRLEPGRSPQMIPSGGAIGHTEPYRALEDQVGEIIFLVTSKPAKAGD